MMQKQNLGTQYELEPMDKVSVAVMEQNKDRQKMLYDKIQEAKIKQLDEGTTALKHTAKQHQKENPERNPFCRRAEPRPLNGYISMQDLMHLQKVKNEITLKRPMNSEKDLNAKLNREMFPLSYHRVNDKVSKTIQYDASNFEIKAREIERPHAEVMNNQYFKAHQEVIRLKKSKIQQKNKQI